MDLKVSNLARMVGVIGLISGTPHSVGSSRDPGRFLLVSLAHLPPPSSFCPAGLLAEVALRDPDAAEPGHALLPSAPPERRQVGVQCGSLDGSQAGVGGLSILAG